jgi:hypothetical protein
MKYLFRPKSLLLILLPFLMCALFSLGCTPTPDNSFIPKPPETQPTPHTYPAKSGKASQQFAVRNPQGLPLASIPSHHFEVGIGSGAFHAPTEEDNLIYVVTDNGPSHKCSKMSEKLGIAKAQLCPDDKKAQIAFVPTIYHLSLNQDGTAEILHAIPVPRPPSVPPKSGGGSPIAGFDNLRRISKADEAQNKQLAAQLDIEALVRLSDGTFWLAEEKRPSLLHVAADGRILKRLVPPTEMEPLADASYPVESTLPSVLSALRDQKGIEALALSPDEQYLYFTTQAPLAHPKEKSTKESRQLRIFKFDWQRNQLVGSYLYLLDATDSYVSEMAAIVHDQLLLVERANRQTRLYVVDLADATPLDALYGDQAIRPTLEESSLDELHAQGIQPLDKQLITDLAGINTPKVEGLAVINANRLVIVNDTDFGQERIDKPIIEVVLPK